MTVPVFELPGTTSDMYFVHVNLMNSVEKKNTKMYKGPSRSIVRIPQNKLLKGENQSNNSIRINRTPTSMIQWLNHFVGAFRIV